MRELRGDGRQASHLPVPVKQPAVTPCHADAKAARSEIFGAGTPLPRPLHLKEAVKVALPSSVVSGQVVWTNGDECGLAFDQPMDGYMLAGQLSSGGDLRARKQRPQQPAPSCESADQGGFRPGLRLKLVTGDGNERPAMLRWAQGRFARLVIDDAG